MGSAFSIQPRGGFSLRAANGFGFGHREGSEEDVMRLAFALDASHEPAGAVLRQDADKPSHDGAVRGTVVGPAAAEAVRRQVARVLSLDHDGREWARAGVHDVVIGRLQAAFPGLRPVLFHSPYEAAAWGVLSARSRPAQAVALRDRLAARLGTVLDLEGRPMAAFPHPRALRDGAEGVPGLPAEKARRLRGIAEAALEGRLEADRLLALGPEAARAELLELRGIGPFWATLIVVRATGFADVLSADEPRLRRAVAHAYELPGEPDAAALERIAESWRPFRTWSAVLVRVAAERAGVTGGRR
jgi:DNA-3-methyladenine glycosylase II